MLKKFAENVKIGDEIAELQGATLPWLFDRIVNTVSFGYCTAKAEMVVAAMLTAKLDRLYLPSNKSLYVVEKMAIIGSDGGYVIKAVGHRDDHAVYMYEWTTARM